MILLPLMPQDTAWTTLEPLMSTYPWGEHSRPGKLTEAELDAHNAEMHSGPAPLGYEAARTEWNTDVEPWEPPREPEVSDFVTMPAEATHKSVEPMAWLVAVPLTCLILFAAWEVLAGLWRLIASWVG